MTHFVWFWTFWHWSKESFRTGSLLRGPLQGIGSHWDEWFRHEASENDLRAIAETGRTESAQRQFIAWLYLHWARDTNWSRNRLVPRFVLGQLAPIAPFNEWSSFGEYREGYGLGGVPAIVLAEDSSGAAEDVRSVEGLTLPSDTGSKTVPEGFQASADDLETPRRAAASLLHGKGFWLLLAWWVAGGERPYPRWLKMALGLGWLGVGGVILYLLFGPEPGVHLFWLGTALVGLWGALVAVAVAVAVRQGLHAWRQGRAWSAFLDRSQVRLRMDGGLTVRGASAGLPFCLNILLALSRSAPQSGGGSWIWRRLFRRMRWEGESWAATGTVTEDGSLKPVVLEPKLRACLKRAGIRHILTPKQPDADPRAMAKLLDAPALASRASATDLPAGSTARLGFAAEQRALSIHPCRHLAQALMALGDLNSRWQKAVGAFALVLSGVMLWALPDLRGILAPPVAPDVVAPSSPSPYYLWVSLDTAHPRDFRIVLESRYWSNRRAGVARYGGANASVRAELLLHRMTGQGSTDGEDGTIWIERRQHFLGREFAPGERVGRYSVSYINRLTHE
jgi:hypothetical protein